MTAFSMRKTRPWVGTGFSGFEGPVKNMPQYGRDYGRVVSHDALLLMSESHRLCCTSAAWVAGALASRLMNAGAGLEPRRLLRRLRPVDVRGRNQGPHNAQVYADMDEPEWVHVGKT